MSAWGSDVPVSVPVTDPDLLISVSVAFQGLAFTPKGLTFDLTEAVQQEIYSPTHRPEDLDG